MSWFTEEGAKRDSSQFTGAHKVIIKEAEKVTTENGAEGIKLCVGMLDRLDGDGKPKEINLETVWVADNNGKRPDGDRMSALFLIAKASPKVIKNRKARRYNFDTSEWETVPVPMYDELIGKKAGLFIQLQKRYPRQKICPENNHVVNFDEEGVWVPNYSKETRLEFVFLRAFHYDTLQTYSERLHKKEARIYEELTERYNDYEEKELDGKNYLEMVKKSAERAGLTFNPASFDSYDMDTFSDAGSDGDDVVPF